MSDYKKSIDYSLFHAMADAVLTGRRCVQAWLGRGNPLFLGFGEEALPPMILGRAGPPLAEQAQADYRLTSYMASWWLEGSDGEIGNSEDSYRKSDEDIARIVGLRVQGWRVVEDVWGLDIAFEGGLRLEVRPYNDTTAGEEVWAVRMPDGYYYGVRRGGGAYKLHEATWPDEEDDEE